MAAWQQAAANSSKRQQTINQRGKTKESAGATQLNFRRDGIKENTGANQLNNQLVKPNETQSPTI